MAALLLPSIKSAAECASFDNTVRPYLPQLYAFPTQIYGILTSSTDRLADLQSLYLNTNPFITAFFLSLFLAPIFLVVSEVNKNYSQVDRAWSVLPAVYIGHYTYWAHAHGLPSQRLDNVLVFGVVWSLRLTYNYWRKGGYSIGSEDYRWERVKKYVGPTAMFVFNVTFIATIQSVLLCLLTSPAYVLLLLSRYTQENMNLADIVFSRILMALVLVEFFADQQQWNFQQAKRQYQNTAKVPPKYTRDELDRGFIVSGLWSWSRHPNFAAEQAIWLVFYQWACYESCTYVNWTLAGALSYVLLFQGSTWLTELLSAQKYPEYKEYQKLVGKFLPTLMPGASVTKLEAPAEKQAKTLKKN